MKRHTLRRRYGRAMVDAKSMARDLHAAGSLAVHDPRTVIMMNSIEEARGPWKWTVKGSHSGKVLHANGYDITSSQKEWKRWNPVPPFAVWRGQELVGDGFTTLEDAKRAARQADEGGES